MLQVAASLVLAAAVALLPTGGSAFSFFLAKIIILQPLWKLRKKIRRWIFLDGCIPSDHWNGVPGTTFLERRSWNERLFEWNGTGMERKIRNWNGTVTERKIGDWNGTGTERKLETGTIWNGTIERYGTTFQVLIFCLFTCLEW